MRIILDQPMPNCFNGEYMREVFFDQVVTQSHINYLSIDGELDFYPELPRPFYKISKSNLFILKGVIGNDCMKVYFSRKTLEENKQHFIKCIENYGLT